MFRIAPIAVNQQVLQLDLAVGPNLPRSQLPLVNQPDQVWTRDAQQVSGLLSAEIRMHRNSLHGVAQGHLAQDALHQAADTLWQILETQPGGVLGQTGEHIPGLKTVLVTGKLDGDQLGRGTS